jgi:hypothetical protein
MRHSKLADRRRQNRVILSGSEESRRIASERDFQRDPSLRSLAG